MKVEHLAEGVVIYQGDCREVLPVLGRFDAIVTDPPYGCGKADWDDEFPAEWYGLLNAERVVIITGSAGLSDTIPLVGSDFVDVIVGRNLNGMTRGPIGFGNWLAAVVAKGKPRQGINAFEFAVSGDMPDHPSPKPLPFMRKLIERVTNDGESVCDPFMGSGTTGVVCVERGLPFTGIEIDPAHFDTARRRIDAALAAPQFLFERLPQPIQLRFETVQ